MRPIDADATLDLLKSLGSRNYRRIKGTILEAEKMLMHEEYTPTLDAEPVRHGHWIECSNELNKKCSECDKINGTIYEHENYCPNCGSKMDGGAP